ncbi:hypothetical protein [Microbulbifer sp. THAF38]|uniref:hypothetical protein n=1 Tax=Microbulbifer sp. THAF38 TaxID=2587856 RepID=UPI0012678FEE|nr:hypothetical protein [Microbulbifer sp. THAF38]
MSDYPKPLSGSFTSSGVYWDRRPNKDSGLAVELIKNADVIHIHNAVYRVVCDEIYELNPTASYVFQTHSGLREGPLYFDATEMMGLPFKRFFTIAQAYPRLYQNYEPVPNIISFPANPEPALIEGGRPRVLFSPTHSRKARWGGKGSKVLEETLTSLSSLGRIEYVRPKSFLTPYELFSLRKTCQISVDEIITGGFHQVSLEALGAGTVCVNGSDYFSNLSFMSCLGSLDEPPFFRVTEDDCVERMTDLVSSPDLILKYQQESLRFFDNYLRPEKLVSIYAQKYEELLQ